MNVRMKFEFLPALVTFLALTAFFAPAAPATISPRPPSYDDVYLYSDCEAEPYAMDFAGPPRDYMKEGMYSLYIKSDTENDSFLSAWAGERPQPNVTRPEWAVVEFQTLSKRVLGKTVSGPDCTNSQGRYVEVTTTHVIKNLRVNRVSKGASFLGLKKGTLLKFNCMDRRVVRNKDCE